MKETAVYDLEENIHVAQSSMNICVKNRLEQNLLFNTSLALAEDQFYIMENSMQKKKIGYGQRKLPIFIFVIPVQRRPVETILIIVLIISSIFFQLLSDTYRLPMVGWIAWRRLCCCIISTGD